jgi:hypothetical protein
MNEAKCAGLWSGDGAAAALQVLDEDVRTQTGSAAEFVPVIFAQDSALALRVQAALKARGIPALVQIEGRDPAGLGLLCRRLPVLVPEELQEAASQIAARVEECGDPASGDEEEEEEVFDDDEEEFDDNGFEESEDDDDVFDDEDDGEDL